MQGPCEPMLLDCHLPNGQALILISLGQVKCLLYINIVELILIISLSVGLTYL